MPAALAHDLFFEHFLEPPTAFGPVPFWFWNDDLEVGELLRQLRAFHAAGCGGVIPHARIGLSPETGYLSERFLHLLRRIVDEAAALDMKIILYDEGSYPSGSARGEVAAENPDHVSQAIGLWQKDLDGPCKGYWRPPVGRALRDRHVTSCVGRMRDGCIDPATIIPLETGPHDVLPYDVPAGRWLLMSVWNVDSGGHIRGAYPHEESGSALAPAAGDILNPDAVAAFIRLTHDRYAQALGDHFGRTIIGLFTDEPSVFGKGVRRPAQPQPYTAGLLEWLVRYHDAPHHQSLDELSRWLPALWVSYGEGTDVFRRAYAEGVQARLHDVFYASQSDWCQAHGIALTGHPGASNDTASLKWFHLPGQDMVWRWVLPGAETALTGEHAVAPKAAAAASRRQGSRRSLTEVCGAYGWKLTLAETKWLFDWHLVRGNNLINPHAFFYSIAGRRAYESEPDLGIHNVWWPSIHRLLRYAGRVSWLLSDAESAATTAVVGHGDRLPWQAASILLRAQQDFDYLTPEQVMAGRIRPGQLDLGGGARFRRLVLDMPPDSVSPPLAERLTRLRAAGVITRLLADLEAGGAPVLNTGLDEISWSSAPDDLRIRHVRKAGLDLVLIVNEGLGPVSGDLQIPAAGRAEIWDALRGRRRVWTAAGDTGTCDPPRQTLRGIELAPFESRIIVIDPAADAVQDAAQTPTTMTIPVEAEWRTHDRSGSAVDLAVGVDWSRHKGHELFSGTLIYKTQITCHRPIHGLDLGRVGDHAEIYIDGVSVGASLWPPHIVHIQLPPGRYELAVHVTNSMANEYEGAQRASGLLGPVSLLVASQPNRHFTKSPGVTR